MKYSETAAAQNPNNIPWIKFDNEGNIISIRKYDYVYEKKGKSTTDEVRSLFNNTKLNDKLDKKKKKKETEEEIMKRIQEAEEL